MAAKVTVTSVALTFEQKAQLAEWVKLTGMSASEIIRQALEEKFKRLRKQQEGDEDNGL